MNYSDTYILPSMEEEVVSARRRREENEWEKLKKGNVC